MSAIVAILAVGAIVWAGLLLGARMPATARIPLAATVMLGLTGYLLTGRPGVAAAPVRLPEPQGFGQALTDPRHGLTNRFGPAAQWIGFSDAAARAGHTEQAAQWLEQGLRRYPRNVDLWVAYGNALVAHAGGTMTPASAMAFDRAAAIQPANPAPPFFAGLALAQSGDAAGARAVWQELLARSPANAGWRSDLESRLAQLPPVSPAPAAATPVRPVAGN